MKFDPSWRQIALVALLISAIIITNIFAPGVIGVITSIVSTIVGALFVNFKEKGPPDPPTGGTGGPNLSLIAGGLGAALACFVLVGCGPTFAELEEAANGGDDNAKIALCRAEARTAFYVEGKSKDEALARFDACINRASK